MAVTINLVSDDPDTTPDSSGGDRDPVSVSLYALFALSMIDTWVAPPTHLHVITVGHDQIYTHADQPYSLGAIDCQIK